MSGFEEWAPSGLTDREILAKYGVLSGPRTEALIDAAEKLAGLADDLPAISDARAQFPAEDFLSELIEKLMELKDYAARDLPDAIQRAIELAEEVESTQRGCTEYGCEILDKVEQALNWAGVGA